MDVISQLQQFQKSSGSISQVATQAAGLNPILANQFTTTVQNDKIQKIQQTLSKLSSKQNEINSFLNDAGINSGDQPFSLVTFAKEFVLKSQQQPKNETEEISNNKPVSKKIGQIIEKQGQILSKTFLQSENLINLLDKTVNQILKQSNVSYVSIEGGQIVAQPIQNEKINVAVENIQKTINTYILTVDKYVRMTYNTDPIESTKQLKPGQNLSLYHIVKFIETILGIYSLLIKLQIKIRKIQDGVIAANALAQVPVPNVALATEYTQRATQYTSAEQTKLDDLAASYTLIKLVKSKIEFYGSKYEQSKNQLLNLKQTVDLFQSQTLNKALTQVNNQLTGSLNQLTGSVNTWTGSLEKI